MKIRSIDCLWPYGRESDRPVDQMEVVVDLEDNSRWVSSFFDTHRFNQGVKSFRGMGGEEPFRYGPRLVIVQELTEAAVRSTVEALVVSGEFEEAFERIGETPPDPEG